MKLTDLKTSTEILNEYLEDPEFRREWEHLMTLQKFLTLLEGLLLDENEVNTADIVDGAVMVETQDGARFMLEVTEI